MLESNPEFFQKHSDHVVMLGDSVTQDPEGYVTIVSNMVAAKYAQLGIRFTNAGIGGNRSIDMLARFENDVVQKGPTVVTINAGLNDVARVVSPSEKQGVGLSDYVDAFKRMLHRIKEIGARTVLLTTTPFEESWPTGLEAECLLHEYVAATRELASREEVGLIDLHSALHRVRARGMEQDPKFCLTTDGVHMNAIGRSAMALAILESWRF